MAQPTTPPSCLAPHLTLFFDGTRLAVLEEMKTRRMAMVGIGAVLGVLGGRVVTSSQAHACSCVELTIDGEAVEVEGPDDARRVWGNATFNHTSERVMFFLEDGRKLAFQAERVEAEGAE